uniref:ABC transmembrane type-1 domain-containing protein n=1 Tax=Arcella intermedia TaxID=1963864 RepID=A0A6B2KZ93_9EUKA
MKDLPRPLAKFIFRFAIQKFLVSKAIFFITNEKRYLSVADQIYTINQGQVHISPLQTEKWDLFNLSALDDDKIIENLDSWQKNEVESLKMDYPELSDMFRLKGVKKSEVHPDPPGTTLRHLIRKGGIYPWVSFFFLVLSTGSFIFSAWWLKYWAEHIIDKLALGIFALTLSLNLIFLFIFLFVFMVNITKIAQSAHDESLEKAVRTWMNKIEQFPLEKLLSIFSNDITAMDLKFFGTAMKFGIVSCQLLGIFVAVSVGTPFSLICVPLVVFIFLYIYKNYQIAKDSLETHEAATYQHLLKYIQETLEGRIHVRSLNKGYFYNEFKKVLDSYTLASFMNHYLFCWGAVRMSGLWLVYYMTTLLTVILTKDYEYYLYSTQNMLFSITLVSHGFFVFKSFWSIQGNFNRELKVVSRVTSLEKLPIEDIFQNRVFKHKWPTKGNLEIIKYNWKSTTHMTLLSDINFKAKHNDRVVIIEKQKLVADAFIYALFRMILPESGKIIINKVDVSDVSLTLLRTQISIMPRDCPLFEGTVYSNIDPKETLPKEKITKRFKKFEVEKFMDVREDIEDLVSDKGLNFSYPQRQLIHLVRISLLKPKILLIEFPLLHSRTKEITQIIQKNFSNTTIIVLSENYKSLPLKYNQVLQLNGGFGDLSNNDNVFQELLKVH